jgi:hypothetical protein
MDGTHGLCSLLWIDPRSLPLVLSPGTGKPGSAYSQDLRALAAEILSFLSLDDLLCAAKVHMEYVRARVALRCDAMLHA